MFELFSLSSEKATCGAFPRSKKQRFTRTLHEEKCMQSNRKKKKAQVIPEEIEGDDSVALERETGKDQQPSPE